MAAVVVDVSTHLGLSLWVPGCRHFGGKLFVLVVDGWLVLGNSEG